METLKCSFILFCSVLFLLSSTQMAPAQTTVPGLIHLWSGEGNADDAVGDAHGTLGLNTTFGAGVSGQAFSFDGQQSSVVELPVDINYDVLPQMTMGMLINLRSTPNVHGWVIGHDNGGYDRSLILHDGRYGYGLAAGVGKTYTSILEPKPQDSLGDWLCIAVSFDWDNKAAEIYMAEILEDRREDSSVQAVSVSGGQRQGLRWTTLGGLYYYGGHTVDGLVDQVFIFNRVLSKEEIDQVFDDLMRPPVVDATIDIKPGSDPNSINLKSKGVVPVAVLTTDGFDASIVDPSSVRFAGAAPVRWALEDVDGDGDEDLLLHFSTQELELDENSTEATLTGATNDGTPIVGTDEVNIVPKGKARAYAAKPVARSVQTSSWGKIKSQW